MAKIVDRTTLSHDFNKALGTLHIHLMHPLRPVTLACAMEEISCPLCQSNQGIFILYASLYKSDELVRRTLLAGQRFYTDAVGCKQSNYLASDQAGSTGDTSDFRILFQTGSYPDELFMQPKWYYPIMPDFAVEYRMHRIPIADLIFIPIRLDFMDSVKLF